MAKEKSTTEDLDEVREDDGQIYVERDKIDFDPDDGLLSGTAIDGTSDIPGSEGDSDSTEGDSDSDEGGTGDRGSDEGGDGSSAEQPDDAEK
jgi:hypothetical protein